MDAQIPGQVDFGDWIEVLVLLVIVAGSVFAPVAKKLIQVLGPKESGKDVKDIFVELEEDLHEPPIPARRGRPAYPVAHPGQPRERPRPPARASRGQPPLAKPVVPPASRPDFMREIGPAPVRPSRRPRPQRPVGPPQARPIPPRMRGTGDESLGRLAPEHRPGHPSPKERLGHLSPENDLGHLESSLHKPSFTDEGRQRAHLIGHPSRSELRRAILMREILGPPLALREPNDAFQLR